MGGWCLSSCHNGIMSAYKTIAETVDTELEIQRSRFLTRLVRVESEEAAREVIAKVKAEHPRARHHCTAFVIGQDARLARSNDDGEPSGTAGAPMLEALQAAGLSDVVAVVTRYFGGVLLGAAGLTRAYRAGVASAVDKARTVIRQEQQRVTATVTYEQAGPLTAAARRLGIAVGDASYSDVVAQDFWLTTDTDADHRFLELVAAHTAGTGRVEFKEMQFRDQT